MDNNKYNCPNCGSDNTSAVSLLYRRGHATGTITRTEVVGYNVETKKTTYGDGHTETKEVGRTPVYGSVTRPTSTTTDLAREVAPPQPPQMPTFKNDLGCLGWFAKICFVSGCIFSLACLIFGVVPSGMLLSTAFWGAIFFVLRKWKCTKAQRAFDESMKVYQSHLELYHREMETWNHEYLCLRCNHRFRVDD